MKVGFVALVGRPNVGKSTLLNSLLGRKVAIVSDKPQTTRISILGIKTTERGQIIFVDNPGIHKPLHTLNKRMMSFVYSALETSDLICLLIDATQPFGRGDEFVIDLLKKVTTPLFLLINKVDLIKKEKILPLIDKYKDLLNFKEIIPISARQGTNLDALEKSIYDYLPEAEKIYEDETLTQLPLRFQLAELIREKLLKRVEKELPFVTAVLIEKMEERKVGKDEPAPPPDFFPETASKKGEKPSRADRGAHDLAIEAAGRGVAGLDSGKQAGASRPKSAWRKGGKERSPVTYLSATIFVEKESHRKIVIGRRGQVIKEIGIEARREIEEILDARVFLDLKVRVKEKWRDSPDVEYFMGSDHANIGKMNKLDIS